MKIVILGDSHTRAFAHRKDVYPFFLGPGGSINLKCGTEIIKQKSHDVLESLQLTENDWVFFHLGEPDCRVQLGRGWHPHKLLDVAETVDKRFLEECIINYMSIITGTHAPNKGVIGAATAYPPAFGAVKYFNNCLQKRFANYFDIFNHVFDGTRVKPEYCDPDPKRDPLHLNSTIAGFFIRQLAKAGITAVKNHPPTRDPFNVMDVKKDFNVSRFGSLTIK